MATRNLRTANYPEHARKALGDAVATARRAAGFKWRTDFARAHDGFSVSSLKNVEQARPLVGVATLQAIGQALGVHFPGRWSKDTPVEILEGSPPPDLSDPGTSPAPEPPSATRPAGSYALSTPRPEIGSQEWQTNLADVLDEETYLEIRLLWRRYVKAIDRLREVEQLLAESAVPQERV